MRHFSEADWHWFDILVGETEQFNGFHHEHFRALQKKSRRHHLQLVFSTGSVQIQGDDMAVTFSFTSTTATASVASSNPAQTVSGVTYTTSDPTVFTIAPDTADPNGQILTAVGAAGKSATLGVTATLTNLDGTTEVGSATATVTIVNDSGNLVLTLKNN
jgi:hypothetical protein